MAQWSNHLNHHDVDEFFGKDDHPDNDAGGLGERDVEATNERYRNIGYHETYETSQSETLQEGFNDGYRETFRVAQTIGYSLGRQLALSKFKVEDGGCLKMAAKIRKVLTKSNPDEKETKVESAHELKQHLQSKTKELEQLSHELSKSVKKEIV